MDQASYADSLMKAEQAKRAAKQKTKDEAEDPDEAEQEATEEAAEAATDEASEAADDSDADNTDGAEQPEETEAEPDEDEVLSKSKPNDKEQRSIEKMQRRIDKVTAEYKAQIEALQQEVEQYKANPQTAATAEAVVVQLDDPGDQTAKAKNEVELEKLAAEAQRALEFYNQNYRAILKAIATDKDTVEIGGQAYRLDEIEKYKSDAEKHLKQYIPRRQEFLRERQKAVAESKAIFPDLFDSAKPQYLAFQAFKRKHRALEAFPLAELYYGLAMEALEGRKAKGGKPATKPAAATPPKTAGDTGSTAAPAPSKAKAVMGEKARLKAELAKAEKDYDKTGSQDAYSRMLQVQSRLKRIN